VVPTVGGSLLLLVVAAAVVVLAMGGFLFWVFGVP
jgi:hypothetical protein